MEYSAIKEKNYNIYTIKTGDFKTTKIEAYFRLKADKNHITSLTFLSYLLNNSSKKFNSRRKVAIKLEELYKTFYSVSSIKLGYTHNVVFNLDFINSEFIKEDSYLNDIVSFLHEMIYNPNIIKDTFSKEDFNIIKNDMLLDIDASEEMSERKAINNALKHLDKDSISSYNTYGTREDLEKITRNSLVKEYKYFLENASLDFFISGNEDVSKIASIIKRIFKESTNHYDTLDYFVDNKESHLRVIEEKDNFPQSELVCLYNINNLDKKEKEITFPVMNYILGNGGLTSKLYKYIREEKSYCYQIGSMFFRYDNLLCISSSMQRKNVDDALKLINKAIKEMQTGKFTEEDINDAKKNMLLALEVNENNQRAALNNYEFKVFIDIFMPDEKKKLLESITKEEIINVAKKIKENLIYIMCEDQNEEN